MASFIRAINEVAESADPKQAILDKVGSALDSVDVMYNMVLLGIYIRPSKTKGGIIRPDANVEEDVWQGKVGLVLKCGTQSFVDDPGFTFGGERAELGEWVVFRVGDAWSLVVNGYPCRLVKDTAIRMKVKDPNVIF